MNTTGMVMTVTDELLAELEAKPEKFVGFGIRSDTVAKLVFELRRLRAENAELAKDAGRLDLLDSLCESYGFQDVHEGNRWVIDGPYRDIRTAADSLEAQ